MVEVGDFMSNQAWRNVVADRLDDGTVGVAGDDGSGRRLAITDMATVGVDHDHDVFDTVNAAQGSLERSLERYAQHAETDVGDLHGLPAVCVAGAGRMCTMLRMRSA